MLKDKLKYRILDFWVMNIFWPIRGRYYQVKSHLLGLLGCEMVVPLYPNPLLKWPVNGLCFCGSRKKFKKCCLSEMPRNIDEGKYKVATIALKRSGVVL